jgi:hypothetical protein
MSRERLSAKSLLAVAAAVGLGLVLTVGCGDDKSTSPDNGDTPPGWWDPDTHILETYAYAIETEDINLYDEILHDCFIFIFPAGVADSLGLPPWEPWWGKTQEVASMRSLFQDPTVTEIEFEYESVGGWSLVTIVLGPDSVDGMFSRTEPIVRLMVEKPGEEPSLLVLDESYLDFTVVPDPMFPNEGRFVIARIEEVPKNP